MTRLLLTTLSLIAILPACAAAQTSAPAAAATAAASEQANPPVRARGAIYRTEVDRMVEALRKRSGNNAALGGASVLATAQILCAMGYCHRFYHRSDGPVVRTSLEFLVRARQPDGSFGTDELSRPSVTAWVADALAVMDEDGYADEIATARAWLQKRGGAASLWQQSVSAVLGGVRADVFPQHLATEQGKLAKLAFAEPNAQPIELLAAALVRLVACQEANRQLDAAQSPQAAVAFSPAQQKGFDYLLSQQKNGVFSTPRDGAAAADPSITAFGLLALQTKPKDLRSKQEQEAIDQGMRWLLTQQNPDGSFGKEVLNYTTSVVVGALVKWSDPAVPPALDKAQKFILQCQFLEANGYATSDRDYGAMGYGGISSQRADLSNTNFALQALRETGLPADHDAFKKALVFLQRTQNLKAVNDFTAKVPDPDNKGRRIVATSGDDGGAHYYPGNSAAGYTLLPDGKSVPRSYGSMTYALLKAYTLCGLKGDDPRLQAAVKWIQANWTLAENPGADVALGDKARFQGLYYYYMVLAQALDFAGIKEVTATGKDGKPEAIDWRKTLRAHLEGVQQANGSWLNAKNERWMEGREVLCTCYALVALERCK